MNPTSSRSAAQTPSGRILWWVAGGLGTALLANWTAFAEGIPQNPANSEAPAYRLTAGDIVEFRFYFNPELNDTAELRPDGRVSLQLIGEVVLGGLTIGQATDLIQDRYAGELRSPEVILQVREFARLMVYVTGEVPRPGPIDLIPELTLLQAIGAAGGPLPTADGNTVVLIRKSADGNPVGQRMEPYIDGDNDGDNIRLDSLAELSPFDVIVVPASRITRMGRWVDQHIRQLNPVNLSAGFTYVFQRVGGGSGFVPVF